MRVATTRFVRITDAVLNMWDRLHPAARSAALAVLCVVAAFAVSKVFS